MASELGEIFADWKDAKREKKQNNLKWSTAFLSENGIEFESKNYGIHLVIKTKSIIDFWPSTGKWIIRGGRSGRGINNLVKLIKLENIDNG